MKIIKLLIILAVLSLAQRSVSQFSLDWVKSYNPISNNLQSANDIAVDDEGNSYLLGYTSRGFNGADVALAKFNASGSLIWARSFDGGNENNSDLGKSLAIVKTGSVTHIYAACAISVSGYGNQSGLLKYDTSGNLLWSKSIATGYNTSVSCVSNDFSGNIFVAGGTSAEPYVVKFNANGDSLWMKKPPISAGYSNGFVNDIVTDSLGNVYGTGRVSYPNVTYDDLIAFKYNSSGALQWSKLYMPGPYNDIGNSITLRHGFLNITGRSDNSSFVADIITMKLNTSTGDTLWAKRYNGTANQYDNAFDIEADAYGNVFITGQTDGATYSGDMITAKYNSSGVLQWTRKYVGNASVEDAGKGLALDSAGNIYVAGRISGGYGARFICIKYNQNGDSLWTRLYDNGTIEEVLAMTLDKNGNTYIAGECDNLDMAAVKYNSSGQLQWARKFYGAQLYSDHVNSIAADANGNVYAAGKSRVSQYGDQFTVIKYDREGTQKWIRSYGVQLFDNYDEAKAIVTDKNGYVYVTGTSFSRGNNYSNDIFTVKLDTAGNQLWYALFHGSGLGNDDAKAIAVDSSGNVLVCGESRSASATIDYCLIKYSPGGSKLWERYYNGPGNGADYAYDIAADASGNVYVTGQSHGGATGDDIATIKYNSLGIPVWTQRFNGSANGSDAGSCIEMDFQGNIYISGFAKSSGTGYNSVLLKYKNDASGTPDWSVQDSQNNSDIFEGASAIKVNQSRSRIYLAGTWSSTVNNRKTNFVAKYDTSGYRIYRSDVLFYVSGSETFSTGIAVDENENVYTSGYRIFNDGTPPEIFVEAYDSSMYPFYGYNRGTPFASAGPNIKDAITLNPQGEVFLSGGTYDSTAGTLMSVIKYKSSPFELNLRAFIQGFYNNSANTMVKDTITVIVRYFATPDNRVDSSKGILDSSGNSLIKFTGTALRDYTLYYLEIRHRNSIGVYFSEPALFYAGAFTYDLSLASGEAFGSNQIQVDSSPLRFAIYSGDVNQDGTIDATDLSLIDNDAYNFNSGYIPTDLNGDDFADATDYSIADNNAYNFVSVITP